MSTRSVTKLARQHWWQVWRPRRPRPVVFLNGVLQDEGKDYTMAGGKVDFTRSPSSHDHVVFAQFG